MHTKTPSLGNTAFKISFGGYLGWQMAKLVDTVLTSVVTDILKKRQETKQA